MSKELRVLIIEDSPQDMALINHELRKAGLRFRSRRVDSHDAFLHELERHPPDIILSDHGIGGFDSAAALAEARNRYPEIPFIFVTGTTREEAAKQTLQGGADDYVVKNQLHLLGPAVERALHGARGHVDHLPGQAAPHDIATEAAAEHSGNRVAHLEAAAREMEKFTHAIALELQLPLRDIESCSEFLLKDTGGQLDAKSQSYLKTISEASQSMARLVDELLAFSRIGQAEMYHLSLSLKDIVKEVIHELRHETEGRSVEWNVGNLPQVMGDSVMLWQVMMNLISNALKFTRASTPARIEIGSWDSGNEHIIFVRDNGVGFDSGSAEKLFAVFKRLHPGEFEGTGVGLVNVRRIIERHGGNVWAEGESGEGATFYFTLPK